MFAEEKPALLPLPLEPFRYYQYGERPCIWMAASKWKPLTTARRRGWIGRSVQVQWDGNVVRLLDPATGNCCANICARSAAGIAFTTRTARSAHPLGTCNCWPRAEKAGAHIGAVCQSHASRAGPDRRPPHHGLAVASARSTAPRSSTRPAPRPWKWSSPIYRFVRR